LMLKSRHSARTKMIFDSDFEFYISLKATAKIQNPKSKIQNRKI